MKKQLKWLVYLEDFNRKDIISYNIFNNSKFSSSVEGAVKDYKKAKNKQLASNPSDTRLKNWILNYKMSTFSHVLEVALKYCFWAKSEYEVGITSWPAYISDEDKNRLKNSDSKYREIVDLEVYLKVDSYSQVMLNFEAFRDYVWREMCEKKIS